MWKRILIFALNFLISFAVYAINGELEIRLVNNNEVSLNPGSTFCVAVMLKNNTFSSQKFHLRIKAPKGWNQLMDYSSEIVEARSKKLKIFSFYAPDNAFVGNYKIDIEAFEEHNQKIGIVTVPIYIKPKYAIQTKVLKAPVYVFSGDTASIDFLLQNLSNVITTIQTTVINNRTSETHNITLSPDSSQVIHILISAPKKIQNVTQTNVGVKAFILGAPDINSSSTSNYKIIPSEKVKFDAYNRIPVRISGMFATNNPNGVRSYGYMYDIEGGGILKPGKRKTLYFHFRGPNRQGEPILGQTDIYSARYSTPKTKLLLGDQTFGLTQLTEASRLGRGVEIEQRFNKLGIGGFINIPRYYPSLKQVISFHGSLYLKKIELKAGYLNKSFVSNSSAQLITISGNFQPVKWSKIKFEYATGSSGGTSSKAYSANLSINRKPFTLFIDYSKADPEFPGYFSNSEYISSGLGITLLKKLNINFNYFFNHVNIALDTIYANAPYSNSMALSIGYRLSINSSLSISFSKNTMEDMSTQKQFYYTDQNIRLSLMSRIKRIDFNLYSTLGKTTNLLQVKEGELATKTVLNANLSVRYRINNYMYVSAFTRYLGGQQFINESFKKYFYGGSFNGIWRNKVRIAFQYQNNYEVQQYYKNRSLLGLSADYHINKRNEIGVYVNYGLKKEDINSTQLSATLRFTHRFNLPSSKRKNIGSLQGRIINDGVSNIKGIMVTLSGNTIYTDQNGEFYFRNVKTGTHYLFIDYSKAGFDAIAVKPGPYKTDILPGKNTQFEISLTTAAQINGTIEIKKDDELNLKGYTSVKKQLKKLIIEASNGSEVYRVYSNSDGTFSFTNLRPGSWKVKVYNNGIPEGYELENQEFIPNLKAGEAKKLQVIVKKIYHKIQFQKTNW
ncbi:MAG: carboxypeptidase regulatory-like domain-containing protein [Bacteroidales bacterium]|nr:carboxypeptidase regulatory-like domain-containing protein [Bacteroidales bacterium]